MKKALPYLLLVFVVMVISSCEKQIAQPVNSALVGKWGYTGNSCNCSTPEDISPVSGSGSTDVLYFTPKSYYKYVNHQEVQSGTYEVVTDTLQYNHQAVTRIVYDGNTTATKTFYKVVNNMLTFYNEVPISSGGAEVYYTQQ
jgi:hypothetical protein